MEASGQHRRTPTRDTLGGALEAAREAGAHQHQSTLEEPPRTVWRIWSHTRRKWYLPEAKGYTEYLNEAGLFPTDQAITVYENSARGWHPGYNNFTIDITLVPA